MGKTNVAGNNGSIGSKASSNNREAKSQKTLAAVGHGHQNADRLLHHLNYELPLTRRMRKGTRRATSAERVAPPYLRVLCCFSLPGAFRWLDHLFASFGFENKLV